MFYWYRTNQFIFPLIYFYFSLPQITNLLNTFVHVSLQICARFPQGRYLEVNTQDHEVCKYSILLNITTLPSCITVPIYILKSSCFSTPWTTLGVIRCLMVSHSDKHDLVLLVRWFAFLMLGKVSILSYVCWLWVSSGSCLIKSFAHFFSGVVSSFSFNL